jgi:hypothetical protein
MNPELSFAQVLPDEILYHIVGSNSLKYLKRYGRLAEQSTDLQTHRIPESFKYI